MTVAELLGVSLLGNTLAQWLVFFGILVGAFLGIKIVYFIFEKIFKALTKKTKSQVDDLLADALQGPVVFAVILGAIHFGRAVLFLSEVAVNWYDKIFTVLVAINVTWLLVRVLDVILASYVQPMTKKSTVPLSDTSYPMLKKIVNFVIYVIAIVIIIQNLGFEVGGLLTGLGIGGLAFALAAQDILGNMFGGIAIITDKPFKVGDRILVDGQDGFVRKIGLRTTMLEPFDGTNIIMPNRKIADATLENISREPKRRVRQVLGLEYNTPTKKLEQAKKILADIVKKNKSTADESLIHFVNFGDSSLEIQLIYWIANLDMILQAKDEVNFEIKKAFEKANIAFAYPSQTIYVKK